VVFRPIIPVNELDMCHAITTPLLTSKL